MNRVWGRQQARGLPFHLIKTDRTVHSCLLQVVVLPPVVAQRGDNFSVGSYVSDLAELVSGWCHVFIQNPKENTMIDLRQLDTADAQSIDKLTVKIGPKLFGKRVEVSPAAFCAAPWTCSLLCGCPCDLQPALCWTVWLPCMTDPSLSEDTGLPPI